MSGTYDVTLNPGATQPVIASGSYCKVISAPSGQVQLKTDTGETWTVSEGQGFRLPDGQEFLRVLVKNLASIAQTVLVVIGDSRFEDTRITGTVSIVDQSINKTRSGQQFIGNMSSAANAGLVSVVGLVPKTVTVAIKRCTVSSATAGLVSLYRGTGQGTANPDYANPIRNKLVGGADPVSRVTTGNTAAALPTGAEMPGAVFWMSFYIPANTPIDVPVTTPLVLAGANVLLVSGVVVNRDVLAVFDIEETTT